MLQFSYLAIIVSVLFYIIYLLFLIRKKYHLGDCILHSLLFIYVVLVIKYTQFPIIYGESFVEAFKEYGATNYNLVPFATITKSGILEAALNIILFIPYGFLGYILFRFQARKTMLSGMLFSISIEIVQFLIGNITKVFFRVPDINDVIFNSLGVFIGIILYIPFWFVAKWMMDKLRIRPNKIVGRFLKSRDI